MGQPKNATRAGEPHAGQERLTLNVSVLGVREDETWCAIALEMCLRGYGETFDAALDALVEAIEAQVTFAVQHDNLDQIFIPAEPHYFRLYADVKRERSNASSLTKFNPDCRTIEWATSRYRSPQRRRSGKSPLDVLCGGASIEQSLRN